MFYFGKYTQIIPLSKNSILEQYKEILLLLISCLQESFNKVKILFLRKVEFQYEVSITSFYF